MQFIILQILTSVIDATLASDNPSRLRKNPLEWIQKLISTIDDKILDEKLQYDINRYEAAKKSTLTSGKTGKYEYLTSEEILTSDKRTAIEQAKFTYSPLGKALEKKRRKSIEDYRWKQIDAITN